MTSFIKLALSMFMTILMLVSVNVFGQRYCGTTIENLPDHFNYKTLKQQRNNSNLHDSIIIIPVVFHVIYNNENENVDMFKLQSQIDVLNEDYRRKNTDTTDLWPQAADVGVEFCMAKIDTAGKYFDGVTRTFTDETYFYYKEDKVFLSDLGGKNVWPGYLNIYVCNLKIEEYGVAGFSSLPGYDAYIDAVVMDYRFTGTNGDLFSLAYAGGRTGTHEVGHWLNLIHPWGAEADSTCILDDFVEDTPQSSLPYQQCNTGNSCGSEDMVENFMDYHYDYCMNLFTVGQAERIRLTIFNHPSRTFLLNHSKCDYIVVDSIDDVNPITNVVEIIEACQEVTVSNEVLQNTDATYISGVVVSLIEGFSIDESSNLLVDIELCD